MSARRTTGGRAHRFGGDWTTAKLNVIARYLQSYTTPLKDKPSKEHPFVKGYIDAFAGTAYRDARQDDRGEDTSQALLLPDLAEAEPQALLDGSARLAVKTHPRFDRYIFIERSPERCAHLELLKQEFPDLAADIRIRPGDANTEIQELCAKEKDWSSHRAVLFLDPYGMQVDWTTIEAIARTKAVDLWVLFPLGIGVNRLLTKSGDIPETWRRGNGLSRHEDLEIVTGHYRGAPRRRCRQVGFQLLPSDRQHGRRMREHRQARRFETSETGRRAAGMNLPPPPDRWTIELANAERVNAIASFGLTERQARFLTNVLLHSGAFVERQYCAFAGIVHGQKSTDFIKTLVERRFATPIATGKLHRVACSTCITSRSGRP